MLKRLRRRRGADKSGSSSVVDRRTVLVGAAGAAGAASIAAAAASPVGLATVAASGASAHASALALPLGVTRAAQTTGAVSADQVSVEPAGEITDTNAQAVFEELDARLGKAHLIDDLKTAMTLVDDFMGGTNASGAVGQLGWSLAGIGSASIGTEITPPGQFVIGTGGTAGGAKALFLGVDTLEGHPVFMCEFRLKMNALNDSQNRHSCWFGLHNDRAGAEPATGYYFRYDATSAKWNAVCAKAGTRTVVNNSSDPVATANTGYRRFRITCDGAAYYPIARFYIDDVLIATINTNVPGLRFAPAASIKKTYSASLAVATRSLTIDYFALRFEYPR